MKMDRWVIGDGWTVKPNNNEVSYWEVETSFLWQVKNFWKVSSFWALWQNPVGTADWPFDVSLLLTKFWMNHKKVRLLGHHQHQHSSKILWQWHCFFRIHLLIIVSVYDRLSLLDFIKHRRKQSQLSFFSLSFKNSNRNDDKWK